MNSRDRMKLAIESGFALATVIKWDQGKQVTDSTETALTKAAKEFGFERSSEHGITHLRDVLPGVLAKAGVK